MHKIGNLRERPATAICVLSLFSANALACPSWHIRSALVPSGMVSSFEHTYKYQQINFVSQSARKLVCLIFNWKNKSKYIIETLFSIIRNEYMTVGYVVEFLRLKKNQQQQQPHKLQNQPNESRIKILCNAATALLCCGVGKERNSQRIQKIELCLCSRHGYMRLKSRFPLIFLGNFFIVVCSHGVD